MKVHMLVQNCSTKYTIVAFQNEGAKICQDFCHQCSSTDCRSMSSIDVPKYFHAKRQFYCRVGFNEWQKTEVKCFLGWQFAICTHQNHLVPYESSYHPKPIPVKADAACHLTACGSLTQFSNAFYGLCTNNKR